MNTIKNVIMVVPVLMTNCQVLEKSNNGPVIAQVRIRKKATMNAIGLPANRVMAVDILSKILLTLDTFGFFIML
jgi:hypothetical protein